MLLIYFFLYLFSQPIVEVHAEVGTRFKLGAVDAQFVDKPPEVFFKLLRCETIETECAFDNRTIVVYFLPDLVGEFFYFTHHTTTSQSFVSRARE